MQIVPPQLIVDMAMDKPGHAPEDRAMDALKHLIADETVPKGAFISDRIYYPMSQPDKLQIPLRKAGYKIMGNLVKGQMGLQATYHGARLIDGSWYFPGMPACWRDASALFADGEMDRDELYDIIDRRQDSLFKSRRRTRMALSTSIPRHAASVPSSRLTVSVLTSLYKLPPCVRCSLVT